VVSSLSWASAGSLSGYHRLQSTGGNWSSETCRFLLDLEYCPALLDALESREVSAVIPRCPATRTVLGGRFCVKLAGLFGHLQPAPGGWKASGRKSPGRRSPTCHFKSQRPPPKHTPHPTPRPCPLQQNHLKLARTHQPRRAELNVPAFRYLNRPFKRPTTAEVSDRGHSRPRSGPSRSFLQFCLAFVVNRQDVGPRRRRYCSSGTLRWRHRRFRLAQKSNPGHDVKVSPRASLHPLSNDNPGSPSPAHIRISVSLPFYFPCFVLFDFHHFTLYIASRLSTFFVGFEKTGNILATIPHCLIVSGPPLSPNSPRLLKTPIPCRLKCPSICW